MLRVLLRGVEARYAVDDGWRSDDALTEKYLRARCTQEEPGEAAAHAAAEAEWAEGFRLVEGVSDAPIVAREEVGS
jgi:hypothetical protein